VDLIYGMGNGVALIDEGWHRHSRPGILAATPVRIAPPEELVWHRLFINERHRQDMSDIVHLILCLGDSLDWPRLLERTGQHWPLLLAQLQTFNYVYPSYRSRVPGWVLQQLLDRAVADIGRDEGDPNVTRGPLISRFSFAIDVHEWGFEDSRAERVRAMRERREIQLIKHADVWDERADDFEGDRQDLLVS
jgi:hypothetical protein